MARSFSFLFFLFFSFAKVFASEVVPPSADVIFQEPKTSSYSFSPNGQYVAYVEDYRSEYYFHVIDIAKRKLVHKVELGTSYPDGLSWLSNRRVMYEKTGRLYAMNIDGTEHRVLIDYVDDINKIKSYSSYKRNFRQWEVLHILPENREEILVQSRKKNGVASVERINIYTGDRQVVASGSSGKVRSWHIDLNGNIIMSMSRLKGETTFTLFGEKGSQSNPLALGEFQLDAEGHFNTTTMIQSGSYERNLVYVSDASASDTFRLAEYDISTQKITKYIHEDERYDVGSHEEELDLYFLEPEKKLVGAGYKKEKFSQVWFDDRFNSVQNDIDERYPKSNNIIFSWVNDLSKFLVYSEVSGHHGKVYIYEKNTNKMIRLADFGEAFGEFTLPEMQVVEYQSDDGISHEAYLSLPRSYVDGEPVPFVVMVHGGPWHRYIWEYDPESAYFASRGYGVLRVNFRGSTGFGQSYMKAGAKKISSLMIDDIASATSWAIDNKYADSKRTYIMGTSYGGYAALLSLARYPKLYAAASSLSAPLDVVAQIKEYKKEKAFFAYEYWNYAVGDVKKDKKRLAAMSPINLIAGMKAPFQVFHGENDQTVSVKQVERFKSVMEKKGVRGKVRIIKDEGHGLSYLSNRVFYVESAERLFSSSSL